MSSQLPSSNRPENSRPAVTQIARGSRVSGRISGPAALLIEGEFEGEIRIDHDITVGPTGAVKGEISARSVRVGGRVKGNVRGQSRVELEDSGSLEGDIAAPRVVISEGAFFKGQVEMTAEATTPKRPEAPGPTVGSGGGGRSGGLETPKLSGSRP